jgi:queuine tRNA-ribosyltransferase
VDLFTYSSSTMVRASLLYAGFFVAKGPGVGPKADTTIALTPSAVGERGDLELLGRAWLDRWEKSDAGERSV